jgi:hypothetical protein
LGLSPTLFRASFTRWKYSSSSALGSGLFAFFVRTTLPLPLRFIAAPFLGGPNAALEESRAAWDAVAAMEKWKGYPG